jgi:hypothetical protein
MGAYHMKQRALVGLSWLNLGLAIASLARHIPREFFSFNLELQKALLDHFSFTNFAPSWVIPGAGLLVATMELALASRFLGTRLASPSRNFFRSTRFVIFLTKMAF